MIMDELCVIAGLLVYIAPTVFMIWLMDKMWN
jgi:hypothetical protein